MGHGGGQVVSVLAFYSADPSSNPTEACSFSVKFVFEKTEDKQKRGRSCPFLNIFLFGTNAHFCHKLQRKKFYSVNALLPYAGDFMSRTGRYTICKFSNH